MDLSFSAWRGGDASRQRYADHRPLPTSAEALVTELPVVAVGPVVVVDEPEPALQDPRNRKREAGAWWARAGCRQCLFCGVLVGLTVIAFLLVPTSGDVGDRVGLSFTGGTTLTLGVASPPPPGGAGVIHDSPPPPNPSPPPPPHPPPNVSPPAEPPVAPRPAQPPCASGTDDCGDNDDNCCDGFRCERITETVNGIPNDVYRCTVAPSPPPSLPKPPPHPPPSPSPPEIFHPPPSPKEPPPPSPPPVPSPPTLPPPLPARPCTWHCERFYTSHAETAAQAADRWCHEEVRSGTLQTLNNP